MTNEELKDLRNMFDILSKDYGRLSDDMKSFSDLFEEELKRRRNTDDE